MRQPSRQRRTGRQRDLDVDHRMHARRQALRGIRRLAAAGDRDARQQLCAAPRRQRLPGRVRIEHVQPRRQQAGTRVIRQVQLVDQLPVSADHRYRRRLRHPQIERLPHRRRRIRRH
jgi:hypothetical protein